MTSLEGQIALVTGAGAGIGRAIALELARGGAAVAVHYHRSRAGAEAVVAEVTASGGKALAIGGDLTVREEAERVVAKSS
jgi:3-oxoacyl-[acyl-carrier protein] reductase